MANLVALGCLGTALVVLLEEGVDLSMGGFGVGLETEFTLMLVKEKGLGEQGLWESRLIQIALSQWYWHLEQF